MKHSKSQQGKTEKIEVIVPYEEILAQEEAERMRMYEGLESGRISPIELKEKIVSTGPVHPFGIWMDFQFESVMDIITLIRNLRFGELIKPSNKADTTLSITSANFLKYIYPDYDCKRRLTDSEIGRCLDVLKSYNGYFGILLDDELEENRWWMSRPIRPADDDGSSWYAERKLTAEGHFVLNEMLAVCRTWAL